MEETDKFQYDKLGKMAELFFLVEDHDGGLQYHLGFRHATVEGFNSDSAPVGVNQSRAQILPSSTAVPSVHSRDVSKVN